MRVIDSHTGGEPTRVVVGGGPDLGGGSVKRQLEVLREKHDWVRSAIIHEPRGSEVMVGAILVPPEEQSCAAGVIFFNNVGYLGMCGHGSIGVAVALFHLGKIGVGEHCLQTSVGIVKVWMEDRNTVSIENVESYRKTKDLAVEVEGKAVRGDVAWGGNWFFLVRDHGETIEPGNVERLTAYTKKIRHALGAAGHDEIDHIELFAPSDSTQADSKNFVLCPGGAYDRSPCGTGTSAKMACLFADGKLKPGQTWRQQSIIGSIFEGSVRVENGRIFPRIRGQAFVNGESTILIDPADPYRFGIRP
ncbi:MAG TPA: proline racemase family protein [Tepidisphaeraceae bacterium]|jgi:4-hydroxyproline epimerase|nr:proline racemase family protein [Tepidisphaeraceae bacterium]